MTTDSKNKPETQKGVKSKRFAMIAAIIGIAIIAFLAISFFTAYHSQKEQEILEEARYSAIRQDQQHLREEMNAPQVEEESQGESAHLQTFSGTILESSYQERASEVAAPTEVFPDAPALLLQLASPASAIGFSYGDSTPSERLISTIRVPSDLGTNGELITIEIDEPIYWPSDVSGMLWDLDLSELQSIKTIVT